MADGMKSSWDKVKEYFGLGESDAYSETYYQDDLDRDYTATHPGHYQDDHASVPSRYAHPEGYDDSRYSGRASERFHDSAPGSYSRFRNDPEVVKLELHNFLQIKDAVPEFRQGNVVVLSLEHLTAEEARRAVDIATGIALAEYGVLKTLPGRRNYALLPDAVELSPAQLDRLVDGN